jgi:hypothetical protein
LGQVEPQKQLPSRGKREAKRDPITLKGVLRHALNKSREFIRHIPKWVKRGLIIKYLPPYSPELNLIEILWRFMKYYWLPFSAYMSFQCLLQSVEDILTRFGTDYTIDFEIK